MSSLSTHVLDTVSGRPAAGVRLRLFSGASVLFEGQTDADGRCPALRELTLEGGQYRLEFEIAAYFRTRHFWMSSPSCSG